MAYTLQILGQHKCTSTFWTLTETLIIWNFLIAGPFHFGPGPDCWSIP